MYCLSILVVLINGILYTLTKVYTIDQVCNHPELSDEKVER